MIGIEAARKDLCVCFAQLCVIAIPQSCLWNHEGTQKLNAVANRNPSYIVARDLNSGVCLLELTDLVNDLLVVIIKLRDPIRILLHVHHFRDHRLYYFIKLFHGVFYRWIERVGSVATAEQYKQIAAFARRRRKDV